MKLNHDCVRECLIWLESNISFSGSVNVEDVVSVLQDNFSQEEILYSLEKLKEIGYINGGVNVTYSAIGENMTAFTKIEEITWHGHEYLDNIRDPEIWKKTKNVTSKFKSVSLSLMSNVAGQVISSLVKNSLGLQ